MSPLNCPAAHQDFPDGWLCGPRAIDRAFRTIDLLTLVDFAGHTAARAHPVFLAGAERIYTTPGRRLPMFVACSNA